MEITTADGHVKAQIKPGQAQEFGRANGFPSSDKTISRRHVSFFLSPSRTTIQFEVLGRNPVYVARNGDVKIFRRLERAEMETGDMFCVSVKSPVWYKLRKCGNGEGTETVRRNVLESELAESLESGVDELQREGVDFSGLDPVKEFGFLVIGNEFDSYPKKMIRDIKNLDWFLEEAVGESDEEEEGRKGKGSRRRKRKKGVENDDEDWTGDSEEDKELISKSKKAPRPKYTTRSKDRGKQSKDTNRSKNTSRKTNRELDDEDVEDEDEEDETLGGFIVDDENLEEEEEEDEEEEEFEDEDDEDE